MGFVSCILCCALSTACLSRTPSERGQQIAESAVITVSAAISLTEALEEIAAAYKAAGGGPIRFNFAGSNVLARQIQNGAPVDVFISADEEQMDLLEKDGALVEGSRRAIVANQLAVVALPDRVDAVRSAFPRAAPDIRRLAIGDPEAVPAGVYARQYLQEQGLWTKYADRIVPTGNVRAALAAVENGGADAAIVYVTDVQVSRSARVAIAIPRDQGPRITYPGAVVARTREREQARRFLEFLQSDAARTIFLAHGFLLPAGD